MGTLLGADEGVVDRIVLGATDGLLYGEVDGRPVGTLLGTYEGGVVLGKKQLQVPLQVFNTPFIPQRLEIFNEIYSQSIPNIFPNSNFKGESEHSVSSQDEHVARPCFFYQIYYIVCFSSFLPKNMSYNHHQVQISEHYQSMNHL